MSESKKYIHYGHSSFDRNLFNPIRNREMWVKPDGGLWASAVDSGYGWSDWCEGNDFNTHRLQQSFTFKLSESANVMHIRSVTDLDGLPDQKLLEYLGKPLWKTIDFEKLLADGVDAIELHLSEEDLCDHDFMCGLYWELYGWDCDSILIMNPDVVEVVWSKE